MRTRVASSVAAAVLAALGFSHAGASATTIDLRNGPGTSGAVNGVLFAFDDQQPAGTGVLDSFVRIQANGTEEGYNTTVGSAPDLPFDEVFGSFTRDLTFGELVAIGGNLQFALEINEGGGPNSELSLDQLQIYISDTGGKNTTDLNMLGTLIYDLDAGEDSAIWLDGVNTSGSGESDMLMIVPASFFAGVQDDDFVILYSQFGETVASGSGFEEWYQVVPKGNTISPEGNTISLLGAGLAAFAMKRRTRRGARRHSR